MALPLPSQERWSLLVRPPRLRPRASSGGCGFPFLRSAWLGRFLAPLACWCARQMVLSTLTSPDEFALGVCFALNVGEQTLPGTVSMPANEAIVAGLPRTVAFWYVAPGRASPQPPQDAVYDPDGGHAIACPLRPFSGKREEIRCHAASDSSPELRATSLYPPTGG